MPGMWKTIRSFGLAFALLATLSLISHDVAHEPHLSFAETHCVLCHTSTTAVTLQPIAAAPILLIERAPLIQTVTAFTADILSADNTRGPPTC